MWTDKDKFKEKVTTLELKISVVGLGYVGLNIACLFARSGFQVYGFDIDEEKISRLQKGENYIPEEEWLTSIIAECANSSLLVSSNVPNAAKVGDFIAVAVNTQARTGGADYAHTITAVRAVSQNLSPGKLLCFESTVEPRTTEEQLKPILENNSGLKAGEDFGLAFSPERIDPGNKKHAIWNIPKIVGGIDPLSTDLASFLYSQVVEQVVPVSNLRTAELVKVMENTQRDVNIALTNLFAKVADKLGIDVEEALDAAATKWNFMRLKPGCGVGGECIGDVAYMAIDCVERGEIDPGLVRESRKINESMPQYTVDKLVAALKSVGKDIREAKIAVLGLAYKGDSSAIRNSPSLEIITILKERSALGLVAYDPLCSGYSGIECAKSLPEALEGCDGVVIATDHSQFKDLTFSDDLVVMDARNCLSRKAKNYYGIGR